MVANGPTHMHTKLQYIMSRAHELLKEYASHFQIEKKLCMPGHTQFLYGFR